VSLWESDEDIAAARVVPVDEVLKELEAGFEWSLGRYGLTYQDLAE
jgi:hypothetical protein